MLHQRVRLILSNDTDTADAGVKAVRQRKINNAELTTKVNGRLSTLDGQIFKTGTTSTGKNERNRF
ncbi:hypothetical protein D3C80_1066300 [compost metagenome]